LKLEEARVHTAQNVERQEKRKRGKNKKKKEREPKNKVGNV
jgi:hypothetical protein